MQSTGKGRLFEAGAVLAALGASVCCILPVAAAVLGVGSAALASQLEPLRPWLTAATIVLLGFAFFQSYKPLKCAPGEACEVPASRRRSRIALWAVTLVAVALLAFPYYVGWLI
jgi:mercuric ion transport protein